MKALTKAQSVRKAKLEAELRPCLESFGRVGQALKAIGGAQSLADFLFAVETIQAIKDPEHKLYRPLTWAGWCKAVVGKSVRWVEEILKAAPIMAELGSVIPVAQAKALAAAPEGKRLEIHEAAGGDLAAPDVAHMTTIMLAAATPEEATAIIQKSAQEARAKAKDRRERKKPDRFTGTIHLLEDARKRIDRAGKTLAGEGDTVEETVLKIGQLSATVGDVIDQVKAARPVSADKLAA